jgi:hypothetical protein
LKEAAQQKGNVVLQHFFSRQSLGDYGDPNLEIISPPVPPQKRPYASLPRVFSPCEKVILSQNLTRTFAYGGNLLKSPDGKHERRTENR